jgi:hypothetical protein
MRSGQQQHHKTLKDENDPWQNLPSTVAESNRMQQPMRAAFHSPGARIFVGE